MTELAIRQIDGGVVFTAKIVPGSSRTAISGTLDGMLKVKVAAVAEKAKANQCLLDLLTKKLGVKKNAISIIRGRTNPVKQIQISGITAERLLEELNLDT